MEKDSCNIIIIFGATGDLTKRKLFPSLNGIYNSKKLPDNLKIIGCGRKEIEGDIFIDLIDKISKSSEYIKVDPSNYEDFITLSKKIREFESNYKNVNIIYYLSTPPRAYLPIIKNLITNNLNKEETGFRRIIIEKPFGNNLNSSKELNSHSRFWI